jgi:formamidopyrimidine-DNA glycosylase
LIEGSEIFEKIKQDSQTIGQVITETNYIINELKDYRNIFARANERCIECGGILHIVYHPVQQRSYLECDSCGNGDKI